MSVWIRLEDLQGRTLEAERHEEGGTYVVGGTTECELNVTYNYSGLYVLAAESLLWRHERDRFEDGKYHHGPFPYHDEVEAGSIMHGIWKIARVGLWAYLGGWTTRTTDTGQELRSQEGPGVSGWDSRIPLQMLAERLCPVRPEVEPPPVDNYWKATPCNAAAPLRLLWSWANQHREKGIWSCNG